MAELSSNSTGSTFDPAAAELPANVDMQLLVAARVMRELVELLNRGFMFQIEQIKTSGFFECSVRREDFYITYVGKSVEQCVAYARKITALI